MFSVLADIILIRKFRYTFFLSNDTVSLGDDGTVDYLEEVPVKTLPQFKS